MWGQLRRHTTAQGLRTPAPAKARGALPRARPADSPEKRREGVRGCPPSFGVSLACGWKVRRTRGGLARGAGVLCGCVRFY